MLEFGSNYGANLMHFLMTLIFIVSLTIFIEQWLSNCGPRPAAAAALDVCEKCKFSTPPQTRRVKFWGKAQQAAAISLQMQARCGSPRPEGLLSTRAGAGVLCASGFSVLCGEAASLLDSW